MFCVFRESVVPMAPSQTDAIAEDCIFCKRDSMQRNTDTSINMLSNACLFIFFSIWVVRSL